MATQRWMTSCLLLLVSQGVAGIANASHGILAEPAALLEVQADAALHEIEGVFRHSRLLRAMSQEAFGVMDAASDVRQLARIDAPIGRLRGKVIVAEARLRTLRHLVDVAERHAHRGIDAPLCGCIDGLRHQLADMCATIDCLKDRLDQLQHRHRAVRRGPIDHRQGGFGGSYCPTSGPPRHWDHGARGDSYGFSIQSGSFRLILGH